jgi:SAM-dependent methyltransferase
MATAKGCPSCGERRLQPFYELKNVTTQSTALLDTAREAIDFPTGDIALAVCTACGFVSNIAFVMPPGPPALYEDQQSFSPTFNSFAGRTARRLVDKYDLRRKNILEIGCGKGDFLALVCEAGNNIGVGIDPLCDGSRIASSAAERITVIQDHFSTRYADHVGDLVICRHTLEHIPETRTFVQTVRDAIGDRRTVVYFEVPDAAGLLDGLVFWDVYYEHCSYFSPGSLGRLFRRCGLDVLDLYREYDDQYVLIEGVPASSETAPPHDLEEDVIDIVKAADAFNDGVSQRLRRWRELLTDLRSQKRPVVWGSGSKCVAFLATLGLHDDIECVVDINPYRQGKYPPGLGKVIQPPAYLREYRPEAVIVMNPVYEHEISEALIAMDLDADVITVTAVV